MTPLRYFTCHLQPQLTLFMWHSTPASLFLPGWSKNTTATQHSTAIRQKETCWLSCNTLTRIGLTWNPCPQDLYEKCIKCHISVSRITHVPIIVWCCLSDIFRAYKGIHSPMNLQKNLTCPGTHKWSKRRTYTSLLYYFNQRNDISWSHDSDDHSDQWRVLTHCSLSLPQSEAWVILAHPFLNSVRASDW